MSLPHALQISPAAGESALTPEQKRFNTLIRQLGQARATLAAWRDNVALYGQAHVRVIVPLAQTYAAARTQWTFALDQLLNQPGWTKAERTTLRELICDSAAALIGATDKDDEDAALKALFDKHSEVDFDSEQQDALLTAKKLAEAVTGLDLGDMAGIESDADLFDRMREGLAAKADAEDRLASEAPGRHRKKSAARQRRESEAQLATQSVREVFRKLASALHPDRETDPAQRDAKTALMQKVNQAYGANDLLTLLELQLELEQVDAGHIAGAGAQRVRHYNKVLTEQLSELKAEAEASEAEFRHRFGLQPGFGLNPTKLLAIVGESARQLRGDIACCAREMRTLADKAATKRWLKNQRQRLREMAFDDDFDD